VLAEANGFGDPDAELAAGTRIVTPEASVNRNDANTFKPYDPSAAIGSTTPGLPYIPPPPPTKCGALSKVISIVVQVVVAAVVTYYTGNAQAGAAAGAAAGNQAGQVSSLMLNGQFDWSRWASYSVNPFQGNSNDLARQAFDPVGNGAPGMAESFFSALKKERIKRRIYPSRDEANSDVFNYIEMLCNPVRRHGSAGDLAPVEFERRYAQSGS